MSSGRKGRESACSFSARRRTGKYGGVSDTVIESFPTTEPLEDDYRVLTDIVAGQILATFKSIHLGLSPDNPSPDGIINRVVAGVRSTPDVETAPQTRFPSSPGTSPLRLAIGDFC